MSFDEKDVNREQDGKFGAKEGWPPDVSVPPISVPISSLDEGQVFTLARGVTHDEEEARALAFLDDNEVSVTAVYRGLQPNERPSLGSGVTHQYEVTMTAGNGRALTVPYSTGTGWTEAPSSVDVLNTLVQDSYSFDSNESAASLASEYGMELGEAQELYSNLDAQDTKLRVFVGDTDEMNNLMYGR